jgi:hypothetical protein
MTAECAAAISSAWGRVHFLPPERLCNQRFMADITGAQLASKLPKYLCTARFKHAVITVIACCEETPIKLPGRLRED